MKGLVKVGIAAAFVVGLFSFGTAPSLAANVQCGETIVTDTKLDSDLVCRAEHGFALTVDSDVTLDLNGHVIHVQPGIGVSMHDGATVKNGRIEGDVSFDESGFKHLSCGEGVTGYADGMTVERLQIEHCSYGIELQGTRNRAIKNEVIDFADQTDEPNVGIEVQAKREQPVPPVTANTVARNFVFNSSPLPPLVQSTVGIYVVRGGGDVVERNVTDGNWHGIIVGATTATVDRNFATRSNDTAMEFYMNGGRAVRNRAVDDRGPAAGRTGILVGSSLPIVLEQNSASGFRDDGIQVELDSVVTENRADNNGNYGIEAVPETIDGGGNKAKGNGNPLQCVNVFCK